MNPEKIQKLITAKYTKEEWEKKRTEMMTLVKGKIEKYEAE